MPFLSYGSFVHVQNDPAITIRTSAKYSPRSIVELIKYSVGIKGVIHGADQNTVKANIALLEAAYLVDGNDLILYADDQSTVLHGFLSSSFLGGTRVTSRPSYPIGTGAEYSTFRNYEITVEGDLPNTANNILDYEDNIEFEGTGGPRYVFLETDVGPPQQQVTRQQTLYRARQQGRSMGMFTYAPVAPPFAPGALQPAQTRVKFASPKRVGNNLAYYTAEWSYFFESSTPLTGLPIQI